MDEQIENQFKGLIEKAKSLPELDHDALYDLRTEAEGLVRVIFGDSSTYLDDLYKIGFGPPQRIRDLLIPVSDVMEELENKRAWLSGQKRIISFLSARLKEAKLSSKEQEAHAQAKTEQSNRVFVVHGHDEEMKQSVARVLEKLDLKPMILHEQPNRGRFIIEKFEQHSDVGFAVVLLSPDDIGYAKADGSGKAKTRARQNVIFELGFFYGKLGRPRVAIIYRQEENFEKPAEIDGIVYIPFDPSGNWRLDLVRELNAAGYKVDANKLV